MTRINTNTSALVAQNRLESSNADLQKSLTRLSTGLRINSGGDDPAGLIASEALRTEVTSIGKSISNSRRASQIISTADSALGQVSSLLNDVRGLVVESANTGGLSDDEIAANQLQIDSSLEAINRIASSTSFQGKKLLDGSLDYVSTINAVDSVTDATISKANLGTAASLDVEVNITTAASQAELTASTAAFTTAAAANAAFGNGTEEITVTAADTGSEFNDVQIEFVDDSSIGDVAASAAFDAEQKKITVTYNSAAGTATNSDFAAVTAAIDGLTDFGATVTGTGTVAFTEPTGDVSTGKTGGEVLNDDVVFQLAGAGGAETFSFGAGTSVDQIADAVNLVSDSTGVSADASTGALALTSTAYGSDATVSVDVISEGGSGTFESSLDATRATGTDIVATVNGIEATGDGNTLSINTSTLELSTTVSDGSSSNFSFSISGGGATFQLGPNVESSQQASVGIGSVSTSSLGGASGRLYELGSGGSKSLANDVNGAADVINEVIQKVASTRGRLGAFQATTLDTNISTLSETQANLLEAESTIRDADFATESANLTRSQILVQSGTNVLSLAKQAPQNVLSLLR